MTDLETTIIEQARHELQNLRRALLMPVGDDRIATLASSFWMLSGLTMLASLENSGLSKKKPLRSFTLWTERQARLLPLRVFWVRLEKPDQNRISHLDTDFGSLPGIRLDSQL